MFLSLSSSLPSPLSKINKNFKNKEFRESDKWQSVWNLPFPVCAVFLSLGIWWSCASTPSWAGLAVSALASSHLPRNPRVSQFLSHAPMSPSHLICLWLLPDPQPQESSAERQHAGSQRPLHALPLHVTGNRGPYSQGNTCSFQRATQLG